MLHQTRHVFELRLRKISEKRCVDLLVGQADYGKIVNCGTKNFEELRIIGDKLKFIQTHCRAGFIVESQQMHGRLRQQLVVLDFETQDCDHFSEIVGLRTTLQGLRELEICCCPGSAKFVQMNQEEIESRRNLIRMSVESSILLHLLIHGIERPQLGSDLRQGAVGHQQLENLEHDLMCP